jgi:membrane protease YdiL (CAAX protease family)
MAASHLSTSPVRMGRRIEPSVGVGVVVVLLYMVVVNGIQVSSGIKYQDWFDTAGNAVRTAVIPLAVGSVLLLAFVAWARWDMFWRDPERLPIPRLAKVILVAFVVTTCVRVGGLVFGDVELRLLLAILATGVLVGLAEELVFRGVVLRCLRTGNRPESHAALWTAVGFGLFHLPNMFLGTGLAGISQILLAAITGYALYLFRRWSTWLWVAMVAHGTWDVSLFLSDNYGRTTVEAVAMLLSVFVAIASLVALIRSLRLDREFTVTPQGVIQLAG